VTHREAIDRVISAAVYYYIEGARRQPELRQALNIVIRREDQLAPTVTAEQLQLLEIWTAPPTGRADQ